MNKNNNILITGITSIHGWPIFQNLREKYGEAVHGVSPHKMSKFFKDDFNIHYSDLEDYDGMKSVFDEVQPVSVLHAGGVCDLDMCEDEPDFAYQVNVVGTRNIVNLAKDVYVLYVSSDLVFSGEGTLPDGYNEFSTPDPVSIVGETILQAENEILKHTTSGILRLALPIGPSISGTKGAIDFIAKRLSGGRKMTLFYDEIRSLITTTDLATGISRFFEKMGQGVFHFGGPKEYSLYDIGRYLVDKYKYEEDDLMRESRLNETNGPPRIGRVSLDSTKIYEYLGFIPQDALCG